MRRSFTYTCDACDPWTVEYTFREKARAEADMHAAKFEEMCDHIIRVHTEDFWDVGISVFEVPELRVEEDHATEHEDPRPDVLVAAEPA